MLYEWRYYDAKYESETFILKSSSSSPSLWSEENVFLEFLTQEANDNAWSHHTYLFSVADDELVHPFEIEVK